MAIDYEIARRAIRAEILAAEVVEVTATGELIGIRDGDYNASIHTRPADPAITPILSASDVAWEGWEFDPNDRAIWYEETLLPATDFYEASTTEKFVGIYQLTIWVKKGTEHYQLTETATTTASRPAKYIAEVFDIRLPDLQPDQEGIEGLPIYSVTRGPGLTDDKYYGIPMSMNFGCYLKHT
jgi:hypothetical protein